MVNPDVERVVNELHQKLKREEGFSIFKREITNKNVVVVLGCTRSGKSTLINYLLGTPLVSQQNTLRTYNIVKQNENDEGPKIGVGVVSCTKIPKAYSFEESLLIDLPGFDDNRTQIQDIINSVYISHVKYAARVKFVLVYDVNLFLNDNVNQFIDFLDQIHTLFKNFEQLKNSVVLIFSKDSQDLSLDDIVRLLRLKLLLVDGLHANLQLISHLVDTIARLAIFKAPEGSGNITNLIDYNIREAISSCPWSPVNTTDIEVSVSLRSRELLQTIYNEYLNPEFFYDQIEKEVDKFNDLDINNYIFASTALELREYLNSVNSVLRQCRFQRMADCSNLHDVAVAIKKLLSSDIDADFERRLEVLEDLDRLFLMNNILRGKFIDYYKKGLARAIEKFEQLIKRITSEQGTREEDQKSLVLYASATGGAGLATAIGVGLRIASIHPVASLIGTLISTTATAGFGVPTYMQIKKIKDTNEKRIAARRTQNRWVSSTMFD